MKVKLVPVIEIGYNNQDVPVPEKYPYWKHPIIWDDFHNLSYSKAGFKDRFTAYLTGSSFYKLSDITETNLAKIIKDHTLEYRNGIYKRTQVCPLMGGYVLNIDGEDVYFPQCCGDLSDINYWEKLTKGDLSFYAGHPEPIVKIKSDQIVFDFKMGEFDEHFVPPPMYNSILIDRVALADAVKIAKAELSDFEIIIKAINYKEKLNIPDIEKLLIWDND